MRSSTKIQSSHFKTHHRGRWGINIVVVFYSIYQFHCILPHPNCRPKSNAEWYQFETRPSIDVLWPRIDE
jgi:hypothetical protein